MAHTLAKTVVLQETTCGTVRYTRYAVWATQTGPAGPPAVTDPTAGALHPHPTHLPTTTHAARASGRALCLNGTTISRTIHCVASSRPDVSYLIWSVPPINEAKVASYQKMKSIGADSSTIWPSPGLFVCPGGVISPTGFWAGPHVPTQ
eukprot:gene10561-biopygen6289